MSTRGAVGFRWMGSTKAQYNHFDSYPDGLGRQVIRDLQDADMTLDQMRSICTMIELVDRNDPVPGWCKKKYREFADLTVSRQTLDEWYCLLRNTQGGLSAWLEKGCRHMIDGGDFIQDSLFCEYAYIVNLDDGVFEAYKGLQKQPHRCGPYYSDRPNDSGYYPCRLNAAWPLDQLPTDDELLRAFQED